MHFGFKSITIFTLAILLALMGIVSVSSAHPDGISICINFGADESLVVVTVGVRGVLAHRLVSPVLSCRRTEPGQAVAASTS